MWMVTIMRKTNILVSTVSLCLGLSFMKGNLDFDLHVYWNSNEVDMDDGRQLC